MNCDDTFGKNTRSICVYGITILFFVIITVVGFILLFLEFNKTTGIIFICLGISLIVLLSILCIFDWKKETAQESQV